MPGFWVAPEDVREGTLTIRGEEAHHLARVRRQRVGDRLTVIDGQGAFYEATVDRIGEGEVACRIENRQMGKGESPIRLCLAPALVKGARFDFIVEKATEVGVEGIAPLVTSRGVVRPGSNHKEERWQRLARAAVKQCGRSALPRIQSPAPLGEVLSSWKEEGRRILLATPEGEADLRGLLASGDPRRLGLMVGPEGGFDAAEEELVRTAGGECFSWGERVLRAETANIVLAALVLYEAERAALKLETGRENTERGDRFATQHPDSARTESQPSGHARTGCLRE